MDSVLTLIILTVNVVPTLTSLLDLFVRIFGTFVHEYDSARTFYHDI